MASSRKGEGWYVIQSEPVIRHGPISTAKLKDLYAQRVISNTTYVWNSKDKDTWQPLHLCDVDSLPSTRLTTHDLSTEPELLPNLRYELNQLREQNAAQLNEIGTLTRERNFFKDQIHEERMTHKNELRKITASMTEKVKQHTAQYENVCQSLRQENQKFRALLHAAVQMPNGHGHDDGMSSEFFHPTNFPPRLHPQLSTLSLQVALSPRQSYQMVYPTGDISTQQDLLGMLDMDTDSQVSGGGGRDEADGMSITDDKRSIVMEENKRFSAANEHLQKRLRELTSIKTRQEIQLAGLEARIKVLEEELHEGDSRDVEGVRELREQNKVKDSMLAEANHLINAFIRSAQSRLLEGARLTRAVMLPPEFAERLETWLDYRGKFWGCTNLLVDLQQMSRRLRMQLRNVVNNQSAKLKQIQFSEESNHHVNSWTAALSRAFEAVLTQYHRSEFTILNDLDKLKEASIPPPQRATHQQNTTAMTMPAGSPVGVRARNLSQYSASPLQQPRSTPLQSPISPPPRVQELAELRRGSTHSTQSYNGLPRRIRSPSPSPAQPYPTRSASPLALANRPVDFKSRSVDFRGQAFRQPSRSAEPPDPRARVNSRTGQHSPYDVNRSASARRVEPPASPLRTFSERGGRPPPLLSQSSTVSNTSTIRNFLAAPHLNNDLSTASVASGLSDDRSVSGRSENTAYTYKSDTSAASMFVNGVSRPQMSREMMSERIALLREQQRIGQSQARA